MIIFIKTEKGSRTNVKTNFVLLSKDEFQRDIDSESSVNYYRVDYRFAYLNNIEGAKIISRMSLTEYENEFGTISLSKVVINSYFSKAIKDKYGI